MVSSTKRKIISLAISLLLAVISLAGVALGASVPNVATLTRYTPGFSGAPGKMVRDTAGNFYVTDFWGKGIVKLNSQGERAGFVATNGRPTAVAVLPDSRLIVAMSKPSRKVAFYSQATGEEISVIDTSAYNPVGITVDATGYIYVLDSGDSGYPATSNNGKVRVYTASGSYLTAFGTRTPITTYPSAAATGSFKLPMGIAYEAQSGNIVVADTANQRLQFFNNYNVDATCAFQKVLGSFAGTYGGFPTDDNTHIVKFAAPTEMAFEYNGSTLDRIYAAERGQGAILAIDAVNAYSLKRINGSTVTGSQMIYPSGLFFEKTTAGGVLYVSNDTNAAGVANILALGIDSGTIPAQTVTMTMNPVPATTSAATITVSGTTTPATDVTCSVNGGSAISAGNGAWSVGLTLVDNTNNYIRCQTTSGGAYKEAYTFKGAATAAPIIAITQPANSSATTATTVTVSGTTDMANTTVLLVNSLNSYSVSTQSGADNKWSAVINLAAGSNLITATGSKPGTATSTAVSVTVISDSIPPELTVSFLSSSSITNKAIQNLDGIVLDANLASVTVNGKTVEGSAKVAMSGNNTYFSTAVTLVRGSNTVTVTATDLAGNVATETRTVTLKPENPGFIIDLPADNSYRSATGTTTANGTADAAIASVTVPGFGNVTPAPVTGIWSTASMPVAANFVSYQFTATDGTDIITEKRTINANAAYAQVAINSPAADLATNSASVVISGSVPTASPTPQVSINGAAAVNVSSYTSGTGEFSHTVPLPSEGLYSVKLIHDSGTTAVRNIISDKTSPALTVQADTKSMPTTIYGTLEPSAKLSAINATLGVSTVDIPMSRITFSTYNGSGSVSWQADLNTYTYDAISFSALDPAGNSRTVAYEKGIPTGDIDGDGTVRLADALAALRHVAGTETISDPTKLFNGDVGALVNNRAARDGVIDITDSVLILNKAYGLLLF